MKSVNLVEMDERGACHIQPVTLIPRREMRCIEGLFQDILRDAAHDAQHDDYLSIRLLDEGPLLDPISRLRDYYPNVLETPRSILGRDGIQRRASGDYKAVSVNELFFTFFEQVMGTAMNQAEAEVFNEVIAALQRTEREGVA